MNGFGIFLLIIGIIAAIAWYQSGTDELKEQPIQSSWDATKTIYDSGKKLVKIIKSENETNESLNYGRPFCDEDSDCNTIQECVKDLCECIEGSCYKVTWR